MPSTRRWPVCSRKYTIVPSCSTRQSRGTATAKPSRCAVDVPAGRQIQRGRPPRSAAVSRSRPEGLSPPSSAPTRTRTRTAPPGVRRPAAAGPHPTAESAAAPRPAPAPPCRRPPPRSATGSRVRRQPAPPERADGSVPVPALALPWPRTGGSASAPAALPARSSTGSGWTVRRGPPRRPRRAPAGRPAATLRFGRRAVGSSDRAGRERRPAARSSSRSASSAVIRSAGSLRSRPLSTGLSAPARRAGAGGSVASAVSVAIADGRAYGDWPSTAA